MIRSCKGRSDSQTRFPEGFAYKSSGAIGPGASLNGAPLNTANLRYADLQEANLLGAYLGGTDLTGADLRGARLVQADLRRNIDGRFSPCCSVKWGKFSSGRLARCGSD